MRIRFAMNGKMNLKMNGKSRMGYAPENFYSRSGLVASSGHGENKVT